MAMAAIESKNKLVLNDLEEGDLVEFDRGIFSHWAVYVGKGEVVHMAGRRKSPLNFKFGHSFSICGLLFDEAEAKVDDFHDVADGSPAKKNNDMDAEFQPDERRSIVHRALSNLGDLDYDVLRNNCEHFASWCRYGVKTSKQADNLMTGAVVVGGAVAVVGLAAAVIGSGREKEKPTQKSAANNFFKWAAVGTIAAVGIGMIFGSGKKEDKRTQ